MIDFNMQSRRTTTRIFRPRSGREQRFFVDKMEEKCTKKHEEEKFCKLSSQISKIPFLGFAPTFRPLWTHFFFLANRAEEKRKNFVKKLFS